MTVTVCVAAPAIAAVGASLGACYSAGSGSGPPSNGLYYPVGLAVATATKLPASPYGAAAAPVQPGNVLYVVNSDFDLQYNGGTLQSYDLARIRGDAARLVAHNVNGAPLPGGSDAIPFVYGSDLALCGGAANNDPSSNRSNGMRTPLGEACAPPVDSTNARYFQQSAVIGAFATDLQLSPAGDRLYMPVRGNATITWAALLASTGPYATSFDCGVDSSGRCSGDFVRGDTVDQNDTRFVTMPGEPFGMAQSQDGTAIAVTQQATQETSLLLTGATGTPPSPPSMQFVLEGVPTGGDGIVAVPHDPDAVTRCEDVGDVQPCVRQAFLETSNAAAEVDLLRYYDDDGSQLALLDPSLKPDLTRPFLERETAYPLVVNVPGTDQRGVVIDETPRLVCKANLARAGKAPGSPEWTAGLIACGQKPANVFIGSRSPASVIYGTIGGPSVNDDGTYDPDRLIIKGSVPADQGVSRLYLAPVVDPTGHYALRLFVVCYDASTVDVFDPEMIANLGSYAVREATIYTGPGPFAMAFDPACTGLADAPTGAASVSPLDCHRDGPFADVAVSEAAAQAQDLTHFLVPADPKAPATGMPTYRFGYVATFTNSYIQVVDLDDAIAPPPPAVPTTPAAPSQTYESVVFTLGNPTPPKGS